VDAYFGPEPERSQSSMRCSMMPEAAAQTPVTRGATLPSRRSGRRRYGCMMDLAGRSHGHEGHHKASQRVGPAGCSTGMIA
jgi:hypothetical protein